MNHNYNDELNNLSYLLYKCVIESLWFDDIDNQLNSIKLLGFNKNIIKKYLFLYKDMSL